MSVFFLVGTRTIVGAACGPVTDFRKQHLHLACPMMMSLMTKPWAKNSQ